MLKKILIIIGVILLLIIGFFAFSYWLVKPDKSRIIDFIKENPQSAAMSYSVNGQAFEHQADTLLPLASTVKIIIATEYAYQMADSSISLNKKVPLKELSKYHYPATDGGAHNRWLKSLNIPADSSLMLKDVVSGMLQFSSNANTEYLSDLLGLEKINKRIKQLGIERHDSIYYLVSSLFVRDYLFGNLPTDSARSALSVLEDEVYREACEEIHLALKSESLENDSLAGFGLGVQKIWSDRLPASTAREYRKLMEKLNDKSLGSEVHQYLDPALEFVMENPANQEWLKHSGFKGGSTASLLTKALYATDKEGNKMTLSYFLTDLSTLEYVKLSNSMNAFELAFLQDKAFRNELNNLMDQ